MFDTETMAELCVKQGLHERAIEIYRRLADDAADRAARARYEARIAALSGPARRASSGAASLPGLRVDRRGDELDIAWQLPRGTPTPTLQCLLLKRTPGGIEAEPRTLALQTPQGELKLVVPNLHSARVAAGRLEGERFVPIARLPMPL